MDTGRLKQLAKKYIDGTATPEEKDVLDQWYNTIHDGEPAMVNTKHPETEEQVKERILSNLWEREAALNQVQDLPVPQKTAIKRMTISILSAAAVLALIFFFWQKNPEQPAEAQLVTVPANRIIRVTLPDSSKVWLNAGSVFKYPSKFEAGKRTVELLEGRAFFEIKHKAKHPFIVKTNTLNVTVLGTSFDVRAYKNEGTTKVSVVTGKVGITLKGPAAKQPAVMLLPKQQIVLSVAGHQLSKQVTREIAVNAWCKSNLVFDQEQLGNVFTVLEKKYNTKINVGNKNLLNERISITLSNQHLDTIMQILSFTKHFNYKIANDSTIVIK